MLTLLGVHMCISVTYVQTYMTVTQNNGEKHTSAEVIEWAKGKRDIRTKVHDRYT